MPRRQISEDAPLLEIVATRGYLVEKFAALFRALQRAAGTGGSVVTLASRIADAAYAAEVT